MEGFNLIGIENLAYIKLQKSGSSSTSSISLSRKKPLKSIRVKRERERLLSMSSTPSNSEASILYPLSATRYTLFAIRQSTIDTSENSLDSLSFADLLTPLLHDKSQQMLSLQRMCQEIMAGGLTAIGYANECP